jgi:hypothetical protein
LVISIEDTLDDYAIGKIGDAIHRRKSKDHWLYHEKQILQQVVYLHILILYRSNTKK